jgi:hypothetical protein
VSSRGWRTAPRDLAHGSPSPAITEVANRLHTPTTGIVARLVGFETGGQGGTIEFHEGAASKSTLRDGIVLELHDWVEAAGTIAAAESTPAMMEGFRIPHGESAEVFASKVRAIADYAEPIEAKFIALGFDDDFVDQLRGRVDDFDTADEEKGGGLGKQVGQKTASTRPSARRSSSVVN